jgi:hypothetical protein
VQAGPQRGIAQAPRFDFLQALALTVAIVLAGTVTYFSISDFVRLFPGVTDAIIVISAAAVAKLTGTAWLSRNWRATSWFLRSVLISLVAVLALVNSVGVFRQLSAAHLAPFVTAVAITEEEAAANNSAIEAQSHLISDYDRRIAQIDGAIDEEIRRGRTAPAMDLSRDQREYRETLLSERSAAEAALITLKTTQARLIGQQKRISANADVLQYASALLGVDPERMIQILILAIVLSCDSLSITLVAAANRKQQT